MMPQLFAKISLAEAGNGFAAKGDHPLTPRFDQQHVQ
jgi:hypothetical protein